MYQITSIKTQGAECPKHVHNTRNLTVRSILKQYFMIMSEKEMKLDIYPYNYINKSTDIETYKIIF